MGKCAISRAWIVLPAALTLLLLAAPALADRLGGAYRGPAIERYFPPDWPPHHWRGALPDPLAYWPFWFEHEKEDLLADRIRERRALARQSNRGSAWYFLTTGESDSVPAAFTERVVKPALAAALADDHPWVRDAALLALGKIGGDEVVPLIASRLQDDDREVREDALLALGLSGGAKAYSILLGTLEETDDPGIRAHAALGLALLGDDRALPVLAELLRTRVKIADAPDAGCLATAFAALGGKPRLLSDAFLLEGHADLKAHVCHALGRIEDGPTWFLQALQEKDRRVRAAGIRALARFPEERVVKALLGKQGIRSKVRMSQLYATHSLAEIVPRLSRADPAREAIVARLVECAEKPMKDRYKGGHSAVALGILGERGAVPFLLERMESPYRFGAEIHAAMAMSLGLLGERRAVPLLTACLEKRANDPELRGYAALALGLIGDDAGMDAVRQWMGLEARRGENPDVLRSGCWALGLAGKKTDTDLLLGLLTKDRPEDERFHEVRGAAAIAIGLLGGRSEAEALIAIVTRDEDATNRAFAIAALGWLLDRESVPRLWQLFSGFAYREESYLVRGVMRSL